MSTPADWGAIPVTTPPDFRQRIVFDSPAQGASPQDWGAVPVDTSADRIRAGQVKAPAAPIEHPGMLARIGRGAEDIYQGLAQRILQATDTLPKEKPSIEELRAYASPEDQKLSDDELRNRFEQQSNSADYTQRVNNELELYNKGQEGQGHDVARVVGSGLATAPLMLVGGGPAAGASTFGKIVARAKMGAIGGGVAGASQFTPSNKVSDTALNTAVGAGTGAITAPVLGAAGDKVVDAARWLSGRIAGLRAPEVTDSTLIQAVPEAAGLKPEQRADLIADAQQQMSSTGQLDAEALARKANIIAQGGTPTKSMVTRKAADWTRERNLQKLVQSPDEELRGVAQDLTDVYDANDKAFGAKLRGFSANLPSGTQEAHGMTAMTGLGDLAESSQQDVSAVYNAVKAAKGDQLASDARNVVDTLTNPDIADNAYAEPILKSVTSRLKRLGMVDPEGKPTTNTMTVNQAEEFRKFLQTLKTGDAKTDRIVTSFIKATDADVLSGTGEQAFGAGRSAAQARFDTLDNPATQKALGTLGELQQGKTAQNFIQQQVVGAADQDVVSLVDTLGKIPDAAKRAQSLNAVKAGVLQHFRDEAVNPNSGKFSGAKFGDALREFGDVKGQKIFGDEWGKLKELGRAALDATYEPPYSGVNHSGTAPMLLSLIRGSRLIPGVPLMVTDNAEKLAAQSGYRSQLGDILAARPPGPAPRVPSAVENIARLLPRAAPAAVGLNPTLNQRRKAPN